MIKNTGKDQNLKQMVKTHQKNTAKEKRKLNQMSCC